MTDAPEQEVDGFNALDQAIARNKLDIAQTILDNTTLSPNHYDGTGLTPIARCLESIPDPLTTSSEEIRSVCNSISAFVEKNGINLFLGSEKQHDAVHALEVICQHIDDELLQPYSNRNITVSIDEAYDSLDHIKAMLHRLDQLQARYNLYQEDSYDLSADMLCLMSVMDKDYAAEVRLSDWEGFEEQILEIIQAAPGWMRKELGSMWEAYRETQAALEKTDEPEWQIQKPSTHDGSIEPNKERGRE